MQNGFNVLIIRFTHKGQTAIDAGQHAVQMIAPGEEVNDLVTGREAGHRHVAVGHRRGKAGLGALDSVRQRLGPDAELVERQQSFSFIGIIAVAVHQLASQRAVLKPETVFGVAVANQHAKPGHRRGGCAGYAAIEREVHHPAQE